MAETKRYRVLVPGATAIGEVVEFLLTTDAEMSVEVSCNCGVYQIQYSADIQTNPDLSPSSVTQAFGELGYTEQLLVIQHHEGTKIRRIWLPNDLYPTEDGVEKIAAHLDDTYEGEIGGECATLVEVSKVNRYPIKIGPDYRPC